MDINTIEYWHKLEHFYPYILEEQRDSNIKTYNVKQDIDFPDYDNQILPQNKVVRYYEIYLGIFKVDSALKVLAEKMHAEEEFRDESDETSCFCKIRVEADGKFNKERFKISSFPWAIHRVNDGGIDMEQWDEAFHEFQKMFFLRFFNCHEVLTFEILREILFEIKNSINWSIEFEECWMRVDRVIGDSIGSGNGKNDDDFERREQKSESEIQSENKRVDELIKANDLLNSFYVRDLERILAQVKAENYGEALNSFIDNFETKRIDVEKEKEELYKVFNPKYLPLGKWPSGYGLRGMQQVAVNIALSDLCVNNVFSVNGPPGTGKTTLLRDIIAAKEVERAIKLLELEEPDDAFGDVIGVLEGGNGFKSYIRALKPEFKSYGILIASNNNSAVKNISEELPLKDSICEKYRGGYNYFSEVSNRLFENGTWGILSAPLGNYANKMKFIENFWPVFEKEDNKFNFPKYLRKIQKEENHTNYKNAWEVAKERFEKVYLQVQNMYAEMQECYDKMICVKELKHTLDHNNDKKESLNKKKKEVEKSIEILKVEIETKEKLLQRKEAMKEEIKRNTLLFGIKYVLFKNSLLDYRQLEKDVFLLIAEKGKQYDEIDELEKVYNVLDKELKEIEKKCATIYEEQIASERFIKEWAKSYNTYLPNDEYLSNLVKDDGEERVLAQSNSPWNGEKIIQLREQLYLEAVELHRVFVENSPRLYWQVDSFIKLIRDRIPKEQAIEFATPLFQSFQMVVPVISSTFASIGTFLKYARRDTFGLLLIDEAGQALPQSAVGAIWRAEKSIIVGDPLQIEPVVTIHDKTIQFLKTYFNQSAVIASKETSVQTLADGCNRYGGWRYYGDTNMWIGSPLLVHGRCQRAIFDIANIIAYNRKMIYGTKETENTECRWLHVVGTATNKHYVPKQADVILSQVVEAFYDAFREGKEIPSLFIITPFRSVKAGLIQYFNDKDNLYYQIYNEDDKEKKKKIKQWIYKHIGTIHTFQGKEADKVIIALGVDSGDKGYGAVQWASEKPNILNVAVTRAKKQLCIIGDRNKWANQPNFEVAYDICDINN